MTLLTKTLPVAITLLLTFWVQTYTVAYGTNNSNLDSHIGDKSYLGKSASTAQKKKGLFATSHSQSVYKKQGKTQPDSKINNKSSRKIDLGDFSVISSKKHISAKIEPISNANNSSISYDAKALKNEINTVRETHKKHFGIKYSKHRKRHYLELFVGANFGFAPTTLVSLIHSKPGESFGIKFVDISSQAFFLLGGQARVRIGDERFFLIANLYGDRPFKQSPSDSESSVIISGEVGLGWRVGGSIHGSFNVFSFVGVQFDYSDFRSLVGAQSSNSLYYLVTSARFATAGLWTGLEFGWDMSFMTLRFSAGLGFGGGKFFGATNGNNPLDSYGIMLKVGLRLEGLIPLNKDKTLFVTAFIDARVGGLFNFTPVNPLNTAVFDALNSEIKDIIKSIQDISGIDPGTGKTPIEATMNEVNEMVNEVFCLVNGVPAAPATSCPNFVNAGPTGYIGQFQKEIADIESIINSTMKQINDFIGGVVANPNCVFSNPSDLSTGNSSCGDIDYMNQATKILQSKIGEINTDNGIAGILLSVNDLVSFINGAGDASANGRPVSFMDIIMRMEAQITDLTSKIGQDVANITEEISHMLTIVNHMIDDFSRVVDQNFRDVWGAVQNIMDIINLLGLNISDAAGIIESLINGAEKGIIINSNFQIATGVIPLITGGIGLTYVI